MVQLGLLTPLTVTQIVLDGSGGVVNSLDLPSVTLVLWLFSFLVQTFFTVEGGVSELVKFTC